MTIPAPRSRRRDQPGNPWGLPGPNEGAGTVVPNADKTYEISEVSCE
jgi:hypothetical protein